MKANCRHRRSLWMKANRRRRRSLWMKANRRHQRSLPMKSNHHLRWTSSQRREHTKLDEPSARLQRGDFKKISSL